MKGIIRKIYKQSPPTPRNNWFLKKYVLPYIIYVNRQLTPQTACYFQTEKNALYCGLPIQSFVYLIVVPLSLVGNLSVSINQE